MRLVRNNKLYNIVNECQLINEDILDNIDIEDDSSVVNRIQNGNVELDYNHSAYYLYDIQTKYQFEMFVKNFKQIRERLLRIILNLPNINNYKLELLIPDVNKVTIDSVPYRLISNGKEQFVKIMDCSKEEIKEDEINDFFKDSLNELKFKSSRGNIFFEFRLKFNISDTERFDSIVYLIKQLFRLAKLIFEKIDEIIGGKISQRLIVDDIQCEAFEFNRHFDERFKKLFYKFCTRKERSLKYKFISDYQESQKKQRHSKISIPDEIKRFFTDAALEYIIPSNVTITIDKVNKRVFCHIPKNARVTLKIVMFIWYYCDRYIADLYVQNTGEYVIDIVIDSAVTINNDFYDTRYPGWYSSISYI